MTDARTTTAFATQPVHDFGPAALRDRCTDGVATRLSDPLCIGLVETLASQPDQSDRKLEEHFNVLSMTYGDHQQRDTGPFPRVPIDI